MPLDALDEKMRLITGNFPLCCKGKVETLYLLISIKRHAFLTSNYMYTTQSL
jgi:hypothetical protein